MKKVILLSLFFSSLSFSDDIEIYLGGQVSSKPNVMFIMDTSRSMSRYERDRSGIGGYNPNIRYEVPLNGYDPDGLYLSRPAGALYDGDGSTDTEIRAIRNNRIHPNALICNEAKDAINRSGVYSGKMKYWEKGRGWRGPDGPLGFSELINTNMNPGNIVRCENQPNRFNGHDYKYLANDFRDQDNPYTDNWFRHLPFAWSGVSELYTRAFSGNFLNYQIAKQDDGSFEYSRIVIARKAIRQALSEVANTNVGLMKFDTSSFFDGGQGGWVDQPIGPIENVRDAFTNKLDSYFTWGSTPVEESLHEAFLYMTGKTPKYGLNTYSRIPGNRIDRSQLIDRGLIISDIGGYYRHTPSVPESLSGSLYAKPAVSECTSSSILLFTDGLPQNDRSSNSDIRNIVRDTAFPNWGNLNKSCSGDGYCADELAYHMANTDMYPNVDGKQVITTHVVGGFLDNLSSSEQATADNILGNIAKSGGGNYYRASDYEGIKDAVVRTLLDIKEQNSSFTSPTIAVDSFNRLKSSNQIYFSMFEPSKESNWKGNLKRYGLDGDENIIDADGHIAVDDSTGSFLKSARSFWTSPGNNDGNDVKLGGMSNQLELERRIYTSLNGSSLTRVGSTLNQNLLYPSSFDANYLSRLRNWIAGKNADGSVRREIEDPLHSRPVVLNYPGNNTIAFIGTNSGYLHAFDVNDPKEVFAFIPKELLQNPDRYLTPVSGDKVYGLDGPISYWHDDKNLNGQVDGADKVILYVAMRRGGHSYYALDITDFDSPELVWMIHGKYPDDAKNKPGVSSGFSKLGQTWSKLIPAEINWLGERKTVLFAGGGYDSAEDGTTLSGPNSRLEHDLGTTIYIIDAQTGDLLWDASKDASIEPGHDLESAFAADLTVVDRNSDGLVDMLYAADVGGRIWRFDINPQHKDKAEFAKGGIIADVNSGAGSGNRRFYTSPDISYFYNGGNDFILISIGSGYRAHPLSRTNSDYFFMLKDHSAKVTPSNYTTVGFSDLKDWGAESHLGWRYDLPRSAEKVLNPSVTFNGRVFFAGYQPSNSGGAGNGAACLPDIGTSKLYSFDIHSKGKASPEIADPVIPGMPPIQIRTHHTPPTSGGDDGSGGSNDKAGQCMTSSTKTLVGLVSIKQEKDPVCDVVIKRYWRELQNIPKQTDDSEDGDDDENP